MTSLSVQDNIFLPAGGVWDYTTYRESELTGNYQSTTISNDMAACMIFTFSSSGASWGQFGRRYGYSIHAIQ